MPLLRKTLFISDLHLHAENPAITALFLNLLASWQPTNIDAIYILGDLFEAWIGDDDNSFFNQSVVASLRAATQRGLPIFFLRGNRDFLIGKKFARKTGCILLTDEEEVKVYGTRVLLMHGDTLCTQDTAYLKWRKKSHNPILNTLFFKILPLSLRRKFANKMRLKSEHYTQSAATNIMDVTQAEVERVMQKYKVDFLIHGHTHRRNLHPFHHDNKDKLRIVLGPWHHYGNILEWDENGKREFIEVR